MENTLSLLVGDTKSQWFTAANGKIQGPLKSEEIVARIQSGKLGFASHVWKDGLAGWTRLFDVKDFHCLFPAAPDASLLDDIRQKQKKAPVPPPVPPAHEARIWFVYMKDTQYGPFSSVELQGLIDAGRVGSTTFLWKKGMADWQLLVHVPEWAGKVASGAVAAQLAATAASGEKRGAPRRPFEARIVLTDGREVGWAICRDISVGGMQILMDHVPGDVGATLRVNVTGSGDIPSFACEGKIVRVLDDSRGFSLRFQGLTSEARQAIEKYVQS